MKLFLHVIRNWERLKEQELAVRKRCKHCWPEMDTLTKFEQNIAVLREIIEEGQFDVLYNPNGDTVQKNIAFVKVLDENN